MSGLLDYYGEEQLVVWFGPLAVDGLMLLSTSALIATGHRQTASRRPGPTPAVDEPVIQASDRPPAPATQPVNLPAVLPDVPEHLLPTARFAAVSHEQSTGDPITAAELAARLNIEHDTAQALLNRIAPPATVNGVAIGGAR